MDMHGAGDVLHGSLLSHRSRTPRPAVRSKALLGRPSFVPPIEVVVMEDDLVRRGKIRDGQRSHWESTYSQEPDLYGGEPSHAARKAAQRFREEGIRNILELGAGQGRDTVFFARNGFRILAVDYSRPGLQSIREKMRRSNLADWVGLLCHDVRQPLPLVDESFDACYSHMLFNMALTTTQLESLSVEIRRVLVPGGLNVYSARNTQDAHYRRGIRHGEALYENDGFIVHFLSERKVRHLARGYAILDIEAFAEGELPRRLHLVTLRKK